MQEIGNTALEHKKNLLKGSSRKNKNILVKLLFLEIRSYTNNHVEPEIKNVGFESVINLYEIVINKIMQFVLNSYLSK